MSKYAVCIDARASAVRLLCAAAMVLPLVAQAGPLLGGYRHDAPSGPSYIDGFSQWVGRPVKVATAYTGWRVADPWPNIEGPAWQLGAWSQWVRAQSGRNLSYAVALFPKGGSLASCAAGQYDAHWRNLANNLAYHGLHWAYLRLGWEMNGPWYPWGAPAGSGKEASFAACFRRVVQVMRQAQPANQWKFVFNPTTGVTGAWLERVWPGNAYVDVVGVDLYDQCWGTDTYPYPSSCDAACRLKRQQACWSWHGSRLTTLRNFAIAHGKPLAFPEWGVVTRSDGQGGGDNPYFIQKMHDFIATNNVVFHSYFNVSNWGGGFDARLSGSTAHDNPSGSTRFPNAAARFKQLFGSATSVSSTSGSTTSGPSGVTFTAPAAGATISGSFYQSSGCQVGGTGIAKVVFFMNTTQLNVEGSAPWQCNLDTRKFANGTHTLRAVAYNSAGASTSVTRTVTVKN